MKLYLIRHAQPQPTTPTDDNPKLTRVGKRQAIKLGEMFVRLNVSTSDTSVLTSELLRAHLTGKHIYGILGLPAGAFAHLPTPGGEVAASVQQLMTGLRTSATQGAQQIILVWHFPYVGGALNWLVGDNVLEWPDVYGATAHVECDDDFGQGSGRLRWFVFPEMLP
jgi:phosphohistidine phosphatase SixA